jgi:probable F420-dependent oxidoreductase
MKIDTGIMGKDLADVPDRAREAEARGYDGGLTAETAHDPFLPILLAAQVTERIELGTGIAVAFARNPMTLANIGYDLQQFSEGRFILGLGSQIRAHIERRFSMPWSHPAARMREFILAMRAIWASWNEGDKLDFRGEFYQHTLMTPFFDPGPNPFGSPKVFLAAVGEKMTEVAGEACDGIILHGFTTERYVREVTVPALERGWATGGRARTDFEITGPMFVVTGTTEEELVKARAATKQQIAFYGSTPAYRGVLELHGWGDLQTELNALSKQGEWVTMGDLIDDEILSAFAVVGEPEELAALLLGRFGDLLDRISFYAPYQSDPERWSAVFEQLRSA